MTFSRGGALVLLVGHRRRPRAGSRPLETLAALAACAGPQPSSSGSRPERTGSSRSQAPPAARSRRPPDRTRCLCASLIAASLCALARRVSRCSRPPRVGEPVSASFPRRRLRRRRPGRLLAVRGVSHAVSKATHEFTSQRETAHGLTHQCLPERQRVPPLEHLAGCGNEEWRSARITGTGPGDFRFWWDERRRENSEIVNAHNLYLETLAESGVIGLGLVLLVPLSLVAGWSRSAERARSRDDPRVDRGGRRRSRHLRPFRVDWDWQFPAVMLPAIVLVFGVIRAADGGPDGADEMGSCSRGAVRCARAAPRRRRARRCRRRPGKACGGERRPGEGADPGAGGDRPRSRRVGAASPRGERARRPRPRNQASNTAFAAAVARSPSNFVIYDGLGFRPPRARGRPCRETASEARADDESQRPADEAARADRRAFGPSR